MFSHPLFTMLPIDTARLITSWDAVRSEPEVLDAWLRAARAAGIEPLVAFEHARGERCPEAFCRLPSVDEYALAFRAFRARYPWVRLITPWNEPNHRSQPTAANPRRAADFYNVARASCSDCTLVAGDLLDAPNMPGWLNEYSRWLVETPHVWGLHNYYDTTYFSSAGIRTMLDLVRGEVWLTETGGIVSFATPEGRTALPHDEVRAEASVRFAFKLARRYKDRIGRIYLYQWQSPPGARFDAGLIAPDGRPRPAWNVVRGEVGIRRGQHAPARGEAGSVASAGSPARAHLLEHKVRVTSHGYLVVALVCGGLRGESCAGRISVESSSYRRARLVNGRPSSHVLRPRTRAFELPGGRATKLPFVLPGAVLRAAAERGDIRLRITLRATSIGGGAASSVESTMRVKVPRKPRVFTRGHRPWGWE